MNHLSAARKITIAFFLFLLLFGCKKNCGLKERQIDGSPSSCKKITDADGNQRFINCPVKRIVCLLPSAGEVLYAIGAENQIAACSDNVTFPPVLSKKPSSGSSKKPNLEILLQQKPDIVIAKTRIKPELKEKIENVLGVPVLLYNAVNLEDVLPLISDMGVLTGRENRAAEFRGFIETHHNKIVSKISSLKEENKPKVYFSSMGHLYWSGNSCSSSHKRIDAAGGINIASNEKARVPRLSPEWVFEKNPGVIIYSYLKARKSRRIPVSEELKNIVKDISREPGLRAVDAVGNNRVYVIDVRLITGPGSIIGELYYAKWLHPELFKEVDPEGVHREMFSRFYNIELKGVWCYPYVN